MQLHATFFILSVLGIAPVFSSPILLPRTPADGTSGNICATHGDACLGMAIAAAGGVATLGSASLWATLHKTKNQAKQLESQKIELNNHEEELKSMNLALQNLDSQKNGIQEHKVQVIKNEAEIKSLKDEFRKQAGNYESLKV
ncbi:hypothetical protein FRB95_014404 [Tulasnella sp. JGI-2019a]|nr:hypothetical protein FRB95_014404 [Tulasnella sp. JGI-2019a]